MDRRKIQELLVYIAKKSLHDPRFGRTKLNKILFYSDLISYKRLSKTITGVEYEHWDMGPVPKEIEDFKNEILVSASSPLAESKTTFFDKTQYRLIALRDPDLKSFTPDEIAIIDEVITELWERTGSEASALSHLELGYQITRRNEKIPLAAALINTDPPTESEIASGRYQ